MEIAHKYNAGSRMCECLCVSGAALDSVDHSSRQWNRALPGKLLPLSQIISCRIYKNVIIQSLRHANYVIYGKSYFTYSIKW